MTSIKGSVIHTVLVGKPEIKRPLERPKHRWQDKIKTNLKTNKMERHGLEKSGSGWRVSGGLW
jgi:hypothetical protein